MPRTYLNIGVLWCLLVVSWSHQADHNQEQLQKVVQGTNGFSQHLFQALSSKPGNQVVSPLSVQVVLAMAWLGAGGATANEIAAGIQLPANRQQVEAGFKALLSILQSNNSLALEVANKMFVRSGLYVNETFQASVVENFLSDVQELDFRGDSEGSRRIINQWVDDRTHGKIKDLIAQGDLDQDSLMVLVNAIYFKGKWKTSFDKELTSTDTFHLTSNRTRRVRMMHTTDYFKHGTFSEVDLQALELPYEGKAGFSMLFLLPREVDGLAVLETRFSRRNLTHLLDELEEKEVNVALPLFKVKTMVNLIPPLKQMGMQALFTSEADFSGITNQSAFVSKVVQKAFVEVNEKGTEAAAATGLILTGRSAFSFRSDFTADRPFLFLIVHRPSGAVVFLGRVSRPPRVRHGKA